VVRGIEGLRNAGGGYYILHEHHSDHTMVDVKANVTYWRAPIEPVTFCGHPESSCRCTRLRGRVTFSQHLNIVSHLTVQIW
jgi:hypothetical protein